MERAPWPLELISLGILPLLVHVNLCGACEGALGPGAPWGLLALLVPVKPSVGHVRAPWGLLTFLVPVKPSVGLVKAFWGLFWRLAASSSLLWLLMALRASHGLGGLSGLLGGLSGLLGAFPGFLERERERERERETPTHTRPDDLAHGVEAPPQGSVEGSLGPVRALSGCPWN